MFSISLRLNYFPRLRPLQQSFGYVKGKPKSREERQAEEHEKRLNELRVSIMSAHGRQKCLSVADWKSLTTKLQHIFSVSTYRDGGKWHTLNKNVLNVLLTLRPPLDSMLTARNFIEACDMKYDLLLKRYLVQFYAKKASETKLSSEEEQDLLKLCNEFIAQEMHILPEMNAIVAMGLCATKEWERAQELSNLSSASLNILMRKALRENKLESAMSSLANVLKQAKFFQTLSSKTIIAFAKYFDRNPKDIPQNAEKLLASCELIEKVFDEDSVEQLTQVLHKHGHHADKTTMNHSGKCTVCGNNLKSVQITKKEFDTLKSEFMKNVVNGVDIYHKTTPAEWEAFERTIREKGPFDIVMDGLNVAYLNSNARPNLGHNFQSKKSRPSAEALISAVKQLTGEGKRVLVIGRQHMIRWPNIDQIKRVATLFLVENVSKDDIFLLYAAIYSGENSFILSNDYMRQHKFAIGKKVNALFKLWQQDHWYGFAPGNNGRIEIIKPMQFKMYTHKVDDFWHLPFKSREEIESKTWNYYGIPKNWACIKLKTKT